MCCLLGAIVILSGVIRLLVNAGDLAVAGLKKLVSFFIGGGGSVYSSLLMQAICCLKDRCHCLTSNNVDQTS